MRYVVYVYSYVYMVCIYVYSAYIVVYVYKFPLDEYFCKQNRKMSPSLHIFCPHKPWTQFFSSTFSF